MFAKWGTKCEATFKINECASCFCFNPLTHPSPGLPHTSLWWHIPHSTGPPSRPHNSYFRYVSYAGYVPDFSWQGSPHPSSSCVHFQRPHASGPLPSYLILIIILHFASASLPHTVPKNMIWRVCFGAALVTCFCRLVCCLSRSWLRAMFECASVLGFFFQFYH